MTNRELIKQLLDEDLDAEVVIEARGSMIVNVPIQGIDRQYVYGKIILVPEGRVVVE